MRLLFVAVWLSATAGLFAWDPMYYYHPRPYEPPTPLERLRDEVWAVDYVSGLTSNAQFKREFRAENYEHIRRKAIRQGIDPKEVLL